MLSSSNKKLLKALETLYPEAASELSFRNEYQLVVCVVLSAQCTDKKVNQVSPLLFKAAPDFRTLANAKLSVIEEIIRPVNYYKTKAKNLIALGKKVLENFHGKLPISREDLITLPGVGRKTANVVLCEQGNSAALPVDTHVLRLSNRLGLSNGSTPEKVEEDLSRTFPSSTWRELHHRLIFHGRRVCKARNPLCQECSLRKLCPFYKALKTC